MTRLDDVNYLDRPPRPRRAPMSDSSPTPTGMDLAASWLSTQQHRARRHMCPTCSDSTNVAITKIVYVFEPCECGDPEYTHLLEVLYHRACLVASSCDRFNPHRRGRKVSRECMNCGRAERSHTHEDGSVQHEARKP